MLKETILVAQASACEGLVHQPAGTMKVLFSFVFALTALAQPEPTFEVASIKPNASVSQSAGLSILPGGRMTAENVLKLESIKAPVDVFVIDHVERPEEN